MLKNKLNKLISSFETKLQPLNRILISEKNILHNFDFFQKNYKLEVWPVLKSNAYGHGIDLIAKILKKRNFAYFVCDSYFEALKIWEVNQHPILLIGSMMHANLRLIDYSLTTLMVQDLETLEELIKLNKKIKIHLKINTGMNRQGFDVFEIHEVLKLLKNSKIVLEGVFSHLADADNEEDKFSKIQIKILKDVLKAINNAGFNPKYIHVSATYGASKTKFSSFNAMRLGIGLYGFGNDNLKPALRLFSKLTKIREINKGDKISYNLTFTANKKMKIGLVPMGYNEGIDRRLSNFPPYLGRICMNLSVVDLTDKNVKIFDDFEVFSDEKSESNSVLKVAERCKTIPYEILVHLNQTIHREII